MVTVTERAATELQELLASNDAPGQAVKLVPNGAGGIGMTIAAPDDGDEVVRHDEEPVLIVDSSLQDVLSGAKIDCETAMVDGQSQTTFRLQPPEA